MNRRTFLERLGIGAAATTVFALVPKEAVQTNYIMAAKLANYEKHGIVSSGTFTYVKFPNEHYGWLPKS